MRATQLIGGVSQQVTTQTANFTLALADAGSYVRVNKAIDAVVTVPADATTNFPVGSIVTFEQVGVGAAVLTAAVDVTINTLGAKSSTTKGVSSVASIVKVAANTWVAYGDLLPIVSSQTANFTLALTDAGSLIRANHATVAITATIPLNATVAFPVGTVVEIEQSGVVAVTVAGAFGVTVNVAATKTLVSAVRYGVIKLIKVSADGWTVVGDLAAV